MRMRIKQVFVVIGLLALSTVALAQKSPLGISNLTDIHGNDKGQIVAELSNGYQIAYSGDNAERVLIQWKVGDEIWVKSVRNGSQVLNVSFRQRDEKRIEELKKSMFSCHK